MKAKHISVAGTVNLLIFLCVYVHDKTVYGEKQIEFLLLTAVGRRMMHLEYKRCCAKVNIFAICYFIAIPSVLLSCELFMFPQGGH